MIPARVTLAAFALVAGLVCVQAAGGIKGRQQADEGQFRFQSVKGPAALRPTFQAQQQYAAPQQQFTQQQTFAAPQPQVFAAPQPQAFAAPVQQSFAAQAVKAPAAAAGVGQVAPVFSAVRVQAAAPAPAAFAQQAQVQEQEPEPQQQQQAPDQEVDPSAAAQEGNAALAALARPAAAAAASEEEANPRPEPYNFQYAFNSGDSATSGSSTREEQQDASGRVTGFYTLKGEDGRDRRVDYVADASGFRATISTNELGTANKDSADADWTAQSPSDGQLRAAESATQAARQRALQSPAQNQQAFSQQQQQQPAQASLAFSSSTTSSSQQKFSSPRQRVAAAAAASQGLQTSRASQNQQQVQFTAQQLQEPFEQIRQTEALSRRARKSRHAPFYLFTV